MLLMYRLWFFAFSFISTAAFAEIPFEARFANQWVAHCQAPFGPYQLTFLSSSGDSTNDDMTVTIKVASGRNVRIPLKQALFFAGRLASSSHSQCDNVSSVSFSTGNILLLIQRDDRPSESRLSAVLLRASDGAILDSVFDLGAQDGLAELSKRAGVVRVKLIRAWRESKTEERVPISGWLGLSDVDGKIKYAWQ